MRNLLYSRTLSVRANALVLLALSSSVAGCGYKSASPSWSLMGNSKPVTETGSLREQSWSEAPRPHNRWAGGQNHHYPAANGRYTYDGRPDARTYERRYAPPPRWQAPTKTTRPLPHHKPSPDRVVVRHGDTLYAISRQTGVSVSQLFALNNLATDKIYPGQSIRLR